MLLLKIIRYIFSIYNEKYHKIICIFGLKIKFCCFAKYQKYRNKIIDNYALKTKLSDKATKILIDRIKNLEKINFKVIDLNNEIILSNKKIKIATDRYAWIAQEVFFDELYKIPKNILKKNVKYCVLDIGANRCYTALYFANKKWSRCIYSFELIPQTYKLAKKNINLNNKYLQNKIRLYNLGLSAKTGEIDALYFPYRDGISSSNIDWLKSYAPKALKRARLTKCKVVQASKFLKDLIKQHDISNIIFKIDVEGAEYEILSDLAVNYPEIFEKIEILIGDTHCGFEEFLRIIAPYNFKIIEACPQSNGSCSFLLVKNNVNV